MRVDSIIIRGDTDMTSMTELEAMRLDILSSGTKDGNLLRTFADSLDQLLRGEGFTTTYHPKQKKSPAVIVVEGPAYQIGIGVSPYFLHLLNASSEYVDGSTVQTLVAGLHEDHRGQVDLAYCQQCDYFHIDLDGGSYSCLLDLELKAGCTQRRIVGT